MADVTRHTIDYGPLAADYCIVYAIYRTRHVFCMGPCSTLCCLSGSYGIPFSCSHCCIRGRISFLVKHFARIISVRRGAMVYSPLRRRSIAPTDGRLPA